MHLQTKELLLVHVDLQPLSVAPGNNLHLYFALFQHKPRELYLLD